MGTNQLSRPASLGIGASNMSFLGIKERRRRGARPIAKQHSSQCKRCQSYDTEQVDNMGKLVLKCNNCGVWSALDGNE